MKVLQEYVNGNMKLFWKEVLGDRDEAAKERCMEAYKEKKVYTYITAKRRQMKVLQEAESRCKWKQKAALEENE